MSFQGKKKAILKKAVGNCGKGGPGWDAVKGAVKDASTATKWLTGYGPLGVLPVKGAQDVWENRKQIGNDVDSVVSKAKNFVKGRLSAMKQINQDREKSYYRPATPAQINVLKGYGKIKDGAGGPGTASWKGMGSGDNVMMGDLTKRLSNVKLKTK